MPRPTSRFLLRTTAVLTTLITLLIVPTASAEPVVVRYPEGSVHGYLALRSLDGKLIASGDLVQTIRGNRLTSRLIYRFKDGSIDDDTAVFTQQGHFRLVSDHRIQKGSAFEKPTEVTIRPRPAM